MHALICTNPHVSHLASWALGALASFSKQPISSAVHNVEPCQSECLALSLSEGCLTLENYSLSSLTRNNMKSIMMLF